MATRVNIQGPPEGFDWKSFCHVPYCPYNSDGIKVSSWWLFLCLSYVSCFLVGIIFTSSGFVSMGNEMAAVGVGLLIVGASLAIVCDVLRRLGIGWSKIVPESSYPNQFVHTGTELGVSLPFLPGYPGFRHSGSEETRCNSPPPYVNSHVDESLDDPVARSILTSVNEGESEEQAFSVRENPNGRRTITSETLQCDTRRTDNLRQVVLLVPTGIEIRTLNPPAPPPYDFETADREDGLSWLYDTPPSYGDLV